MSATEQHGTPELAILSARLQDALRSVAKVPDQLPWYLLLGSPQAGKTALLANSGLRFPLAATQRKTGGTADCDWWLGEEAVFLDTAGRYLFQDGQPAVEQVTWLGFLQLLRTHRPRQPLNGLLVFVSIADFLRRDTGQRSRCAQSIRLRIQELHEQLGTRFPVYVLFTKMDLLAGFADFFEDLDDEGRQQVWGMSFPYLNDPKQSSVMHFRQEFSLLEGRLYQQLITKMDKAHSMESRRSRYLFPQQFSLLGDDLQVFLEHVFQPSRYDSAAMLRGVYFTSATQTGTPADRITASLAASFGISPPAAGHGKQPVTGHSFFIRALLSKVIFREADLAGTHQIVDLQARKQEWDKSIIWVGTAALLAIVAIIWFNR